MNNNNEGSLVRDNNNQLVQAFPLPASGRGVIIPTGVAHTVVSSGVYRFHVSVDMNVSIGLVTTASDLFMQANVDEYFYLAKGDVLSTIATAAAGTIHIVRM